MQSVVSLIRALRTRAHGRQSGQSMVELGLLLPLFLVLAIGVIEVASAINTHVTVINSARDGARLASRGLVGDDEIKSLVVVESERLRDPIDPSSDIDIDRFDYDGVDAVSVQVCNDHSLLLNVPLVMPDTFRMCSATVMRMGSED
jgi:hypothetical protein